MVVPIDGFTIFLNLSRKDLGHSKPVIVPPKQAHQLIVWMIQDYIQAPWTIFSRIKLGTTSLSGGTFIPDSSVCNRGADLDVIRSHQYSCWLDDVKS